MNVVSIIDLSVPEGLPSRQLASAAIRDACHTTNANLSRVMFEKLDFGETSVVDAFYNADVVIVDMSIQAQQMPLVYHLGVRESFDHKENIVIYCDHSNTSSQNKTLKLTCASYTFVPYTLNSTRDNVLAEDAIKVLISESSGPNFASGGSVFINTKKELLLYDRLLDILQKVDVDTTAHLKEKFLSDLRKTRESLRGSELSQALAKLRMRLDDPTLLSGDVIHNMLISYREIQDYDNMVSLVEDYQSLPLNAQVTATAAIQHLYAFALNRRNNDGDREKALAVITKSLEKKENHVPDLLCLCGRIYKDKFHESDGVDTEARDNAIHWYRKGFEVQPNEYAGINLATLLVIAGNDFSSCLELQQIGMTLTNLIGRKGALTSLTDYWDVATFCEIHVLAEDYGKAVQAAECMFHLSPPTWYLKSTIGNIRLIDKFRKQCQSESEQNATTDEQCITCRCADKHANINLTFNFWMEFFDEAGKSDGKEAQSVDNLFFPTLILEPNRVYMPSYVSVSKVVADDGGENSSVRIWHANSDEGGKQVHEWHFESSNIKGVR